MLESSNKPVKEATSVGVVRPDKDAGTGLLQRQNNESETDSDCSARRKNGQSIPEQVSDAWGHWVRHTWTDGWAINNEVATWWCQWARVAADPAEWSRRNPKLACTLAELSARTAERNIALTWNLQRKLAESLRPFGKIGPVATRCPAGAGDEVRNQTRAWMAHLASAWSKTAATWADYWLLPPSP